MIKKKEEVRIQAIFSPSPDTPLQECVPIRHAITILNMLSSLTAPGNSNENSAHCFLHTAEFNYKAYHFDSSLLLFFLSQKSYFVWGARKQNLEQLINKSFTYLPGIWEVDCEAVLLQILATRELMIGGLKRLCQ